MASDMTLSGIDAAVEAYIHRRCRPLGLSGVWRHAVDRDAMEVVIKSHNRCAVGSVDYLRIITLKHRPYEAIEMVAAVVDEVVALLVSKKLATPRVYARSPFDGTNWYADEPPPPPEKENPQTHNELGEIGP